jgi:hypothetical protein
MRILKRLYFRDAKSRLLSQAFNEAVKEMDVPLPFEYMEFHVGYSRSEIEDSRASFGLQVDSAMLADADWRIAKTLIKFELYRLFVRNLVTRKLPSLVEDVMTAREMIRRGHADDLVYLFYVYMARHRVHDYMSFVRFNTPWLIFYGCDGFYNDLFYQLAQTRRRYSYERRAKPLFSALCRDLTDFDNLKAALEAYEHTKYE